jgi:formate hydrogenlyase subunit 4
MVEEGVELEFSGRALGLVRWAGAMRLTFGLSLVVFLTSPPGRAGFGEPLRMVEGLAGYLIKLAALALVLACWEITRVKVRLRAMVTPLLIGIGVLLFCVVTLVVGYVEQGG